MASFRGTLRLEGRDERAVMATLLERLRAEHPLSVSYDGNHVEFTDGVLRGSNRYSVLKPFGWGTVEVDAGTGTVRYRVNFNKLLKFGALATLGMLVFAALGWRQSELGLLGKGLVVGCWVLLLWVWVVGMNLLIGAVRFRWFVRRAIREGSSR